MRGWLAVAAGLVSVPAMAADQFDLTCKVGATSTLRYRVDVARAEACEGACERIWRTGLITSGEIRLLDIDSNDPTAVPQTITVNRQTGRWRHWIGGAGRPITEEGICTPAEFSGFPTAKF